MGYAPFPVSGAVILALLESSDAVDWCRECCSGEWYFTPTVFNPVQLGTLVIPVFCFYFSSRVDHDMFSSAHETQKKLALEVLVA